MMMTKNNHKRMSVASAKEDRISNLPVPLIDSILERLPVQDVVRTSILSKKWRYRWTAMRSLVFDADFSEKFTRNGAFGRNGLIRIITHVLFFHKGPILKFDLHVPNDMELDSFQEVDQWLLFLSRNSVEEFYLANFNDRYHLPSYLFSYVGLRKLHLENCTLKPPPEFQGFPNLEHLCLLDVDIRATLSESMMNLPQLKHITMIECTNAHNFNIKAAKLQELIVFACPGVPLLHLFNYPCLTSISIHSSRPTQGSTQVKKMILSKMFRDLSNIMDIAINGLFLKLYIAEDIPKWLPHTADSLRRLTLTDMMVGDQFQLQAVLCMLRNSPNLEEITVQNNQMGLGSIHFDAEQTFYCLDQPLNRLQTVKITSIEGLWVELMFIKLLLEHSPKLKQMIIRLQSTIDAHTRHSVTKNVMGYKRASVEVEILIESTPPPEYVLPFFD